MKPLISRRCLALLLSLLLCLPAAAGAGPTPQAYLARQFLLALLRGEYAAAYALLAPETQAAMSRQQFRQAAAPLYEQGRQAGAAIELYRLGLRLGENDDTRWFYAFTFRSDSAATAPTQLDVTFRDSVTARVLEFRLVPGKGR